MLRDDPVTSRPVRDCSANRQDFASSFHARNEWRVWFQLIAATAHQNVDIVDAPSMGANQDFIRSRHAWFWAVFERQHLRAAKRRADNRAH